MPCVDPEKRKAWKRADYAKNREKYTAQKRERYARDPEAAKEINRRSRLKHIDDRRAKDSENGKRYYAANREKILKRTLQNERHRYQSDWAYAEARRIRCRTRDAFKRAGACKPGATMAMLGCTASELAAHIESQFLPGMSWDNRRQWHLDHIYPLCAANLSDPAEARAVCSWKNLRPLWKADNLAKSGRVDKEAVSLFERLKESVSPHQKELAT